MDQDLRHSVYGAVSLNVGDKMIRPIRSYTPPGGEGSRMIGSANYTKAKIGDKKGESITLSYYIKEVGSVKEAEVIKKKIDKLVEELGGETVLTASKG